MKKRRWKFRLSSRLVNQTLFGFRVKEWSLKIGWLDMTYCPSIGIPDWFSFTLGPSGLWISLLSYPLLVISPGEGWMLGLAGFTIFGGDYSE